jgi:hypothetical protein
LKNDTQAFHMRNVQVILIRLNKHTYTTSNHATELIHAADLYHAA